MKKLIIAIWLTLTCLGFSQNFWNQIGSFFSAANYAFALDSEGTVYEGNGFGIRRSSDDGKTW